MLDIEFDLVEMSALIWLPTLFALILCFPWRIHVDYLRWWALFGTAFTLVLAMIVFIEYYQMADRMDQGGLPGHGRAVLLSNRADLDNKAQGEFQKRDNRDWISRISWLQRFNIDYYIGVDGISMALVLMSTVLFFLAMIASWNIEKHVRGYLILMLVLETGVLGTFLSLDFFLFYIFWEVMLLPMYFLIGVWGGPRREYAAIKFFLFTVAGSILILLGMLALYFTDVRDFVDPGIVKQQAQLLMARQGKEAISFEEAKKAPIHSFDLLVLTKAGRAAVDVIQGRADEVAHRLAASTDAEPEAVRERLNQPFFTAGFQITVFLLLFVGFAIKVPVFPLHTWLPDAHVEAPTPVSMILAGVLLKTGAYGLLRITYPICPWAAEYLAYWIALFGVINIVYGALAAMAQADFKKLVAYSSVSHMGYVILGIAAWSASPRTTQFWQMGMNGAVFQMVAHGATAAGMFFLVGVLNERANHRNLDNFRGLTEPMPLFSGVSAVIFFAAMGLPGLCGFFGEFLVVLGAWSFSPTFAILAALTIVLTAAYILWAVQRVFLGTNASYKHFTDVTPRELACVLPLVVASVALGVAPNLLLYWVEPSVTGLVNSLSRLPGW